ncbi:transcription initiation factor TFIID subunit 8 [Mercurialis annua]|uniref:transcription initiation factor TFIID subunit 8 n=1 Tax=Mercurialis annua TaxID=3986 RepID=UPI00216095AE|nr:transcription initiation factor TFIID subunit 8 [Mercurialis annua]
MKTKSKRKVPKTNLPKPTEPSDFAYKVTEIAVSQICQSMGFTSTHLSALETLTKIAILYLKTLAKTAVTYSNASNRTESNVFDIFNALHDLSPVPGFMGPSNCVLKSKLVKDVSVFVSSVDEIPFAKAIPRAGPICEAQNAENLGFGGLNYVPKWLPGFPDEKTYKKCEELEKGGELGLWENNCGGSGKWDECVIGEIGKKNGDLGVERDRDRDRVRFKIGEVKKGGIDIRVYKRSWACKGFAYDF